MDGSERGSNRAAHLLEEEATCAPCKRPSVIIMQT